MIHDLIWAVIQIGETVFTFASLVIAVGWAAGKVDIRWKAKYRWRCPEDNCIFKINTSDQNVAWDIAADHMIKFHEGRPGQLKP